MSCAEHVVSLAARPAAMGRRRFVSGFTLLELLIAIALMAVLAVLCWRGLDAVLRSRDRVNAATDEMRALTVAFSQMGDDLRRAWPVRLMRIKARDPISFSSEAQDGPVALEMLRETTGFEESLRLQRVVYRLRGTQLERGFGPWQATTAEADAVVTEANMTWQPLLIDVVGLEFRVYIEEQRAWVSAQALANTPSVVSRQGSANSTAGQAIAQAASLAAIAQGGLPVPNSAAGRTVTGIEVQMARRNGGRLVRVFAVKD